MDDASGTQHPARSRWSVAPYFFVDDVVATANFYRDQLGFEYERFWGEPPAFCMVFRGGIILMLSQLPRHGAMRPNRIADPSGEAWDAYIWVENADQLYQEFTAKGVKIARGLCDQPYGNRDFDVEDCNGFRLCFGHGISA
ncbi:MAG TPA: VOC family protein [Bryobacteraceae bacterium]|nr:VOC family protein [Bryobacteraceae bacterium]